MNFVEIERVMGTNYVLRFFSSREIPIHKTHALAIKSIVDLVAKELGATPIIVKAHCLNLSTELSFIFPDRSPLKYKVLKRDLTEPITGTQISIISRKIISGFSQEENDYFRISGDMVAEFAPDSFIEIGRWMRSKYELRLFAPRDESANREINTDAIQALIELVVDQFDGYWFTIFTRYCVHTWELQFSLLQYYQLYTMPWTVSNLELQQLRSSSCLSLISSMISNAINHAISRQDGETTRSDRGDRLVHPHFYNRNTGESVPIGVDQVKQYIGDITCKYNARSNYLCCAINPGASCEGCRDYEKA